MPALRRAGAESQLVTLANGLPSEHFEKHLLSYRPSDDLRYSVDTDEVKLHELHRRRRLDISVGREIGSVIDKYEIDIVHCTLLNALLFGFMGRLFAKRCPQIVSVIHTTKNVHVKHDIVDLLINRQLLKRCEQVWFVSIRQAQRWIMRMPFLTDRHCVIHNGIDPDEFCSSLFHGPGQELRAKLGIAEGAKVICCVAGFRPEKQHTALIDAFCLIRSKGLPCHLLLAGKGPTEEEVRNKVNKSNLDKDVVFLGALPDVRSLLAASDCKVLVSAAETFSMAMLEAMAMQVPVITTSVGGAGEAIEDGVSGYLVPPGDVVQLASKIDEILNDDDRRLAMGVIARQIVVDRFGVERMIAMSATSLLKLSSDSQLKSCLC